MSYPFLLVLHNHLPMVVNHGRWPHGSDWLCEAAFECYLPLVETAHRLLADGIAPKWTINISPILAEQLASPEFQKELAFYYENVRRACVDTREYFEREGRQELVKLTHFWEEFYERMWELHRRIGGDIPGTLGDLEARGAIEIITCAATHGYLPLLSRDESIHLQLRTAVETHRRHFGRSPRGIWLPECAYRPRYEWTPPTGSEQGKQRRVRPGIEEMLAAHGLRYFVADSHLIAAAAPVFLYRDYFPLRGQLEAAAPEVPRAKPRSPYVPWRVSSRGGSGDAVAFFRDPKTTLQVWSREHGYPGDYLYLEFHKKHFPGGLRLWRITDSTGDLGSKAPYEPHAALQQVGMQARHFAGLVRETAAAAADGDRPPVICAPYDAELFGHWWFEGPTWLEQVARNLPALGVTAMTLGEGLEAVPPQASVALPEGSWGEGGDHRVWLNPDTEWTWDRVYSAEDEWVQLLGLGLDQRGGDFRRVLAQATRELLLLQASDWQFLISTWSARDYAERRVAEHYAEFKRLAEMARGLADGHPLTPEAADLLRRLEREDFCFHDLDPAWGRGAASAA